MNVAIRIAMFAIAFSVLWAPPCTAAEQTAKMYRIGYLAPDSAPDREELFRAELRRLGYVEGKNIVIEYRSAGSDFDGLSRLATELVAGNVDVIVAVRTQASIAAKRATTTIPIVMIGVGDPVGSGLAASLARPGGNVTGTSTFVIDVVGKQLELIRDLVPRASRIAVLWNPANAVFQEQQVAEAKIAAAKLRMDLRLIETRTPQEIDRAFAAFVKERTDAVLVLTDPLFVSHAKRLGDLAVRYRTPAVSGLRQLAEAGFVATYGPGFAQEYARSATYVARILKGAKPADLPIEQMSDIELVINARSTQALDIAIPAPLIARATQIVR